MKPNGSHRAEVQKLIVARPFRGQGIGAALMTAVEAAAREAGRWLLVLDTRQGDTAERLYRRLGWVEAGVIPDFALNSEGTADATVVFYKRL
jgi:GNAT superfamily N-acetyltransferase